MPAHEPIRRAPAGQYLHGQQDRLWAVMESTAAPLFSMDTEGCYTSFNRSHAEIMRALYGAEIELGAPLTGYMTVKADRAVAWCNIQRALGGEQFMAEAEYGDDALSRRYFEISHNPLRDAGGRVTGVRAFAHDLTERKRAEAALHDAETRYRLLFERKRAEEDRLDLERRLQQSQRLESLGVLAGGIAHDFNNILMAVLGNADLALSELSPSAPARENLLQITQASRRAAELRRQMLAYSGRGHFVIERIDLSALIEDMLHLLKSTISKKALLNLHLTKDLPSLRGDASQLSQVIMNLVINASEAIGERSGVIAISTGAMECTREYLHETYAEQRLPSGLYVTLEVSDTGMGMDKETQERIFEPFFTTKFTGRGLGLSAVLGIVRGHKGALKLYSEPDKGTTFKLLFPAEDTPTEAPARKNAPQTGDWQGEGTVLLVDDEETIRAVGARMIESLGFKAIVAADGREALDVYRLHMSEIVLVLLDLTMPHMNGEEAFRELRRLNPDVRVVMSSGYTESDTTARFAGKGLVGFLQKPYNQAELWEKMRAALDIPQNTGREIASPATPTNGATTASRNPS